MMASDLQIDIYVYDDETETGTTTTTELLTIGIIGTSGGGRESWGRWGSYGPHLGDSYGGDFICRAQLGGADLQYTIGDLVSFPFCFFYDSRDDPFLALYGLEPQTLLIEGKGTTVGLGNFTRYREVRTKLTAKWRL
jgi:hypothetical protein